MFNSMFYVTNFRQDPSQWDVGRTSSCSHFSNSGCNPPGLVTLGCAACCPTHVAHSVEFSEAESLYGHFINDSVNVTCDDFSGHIHGSDGLAHCEADGLYNLSNALCYGFVRFLPLSPTSFSPICCINIVHVRVNLTVGLDCGPPEADPNGANYTFASGSTSRDAVREILPGCAAGFEGAAGANETTCLDEGYWDPVPLFGCLGPSVFVNWSPTF